MANFLQVEIDSKKLDEIYEHCTFEYMKKNKTKVVPSGGALWNDGGNSFLNKGVNGSWKNLLSETDILLYERLSLEKLGRDCAHWLQFGGDLRKFNSNL